MIQVTEYEEQEDGSAIMELSLSEEAIQLLIQEGLTSVLKRKLDETRSVYEEKRKD